MEEFLKDEYFWYTLSFLIFAGIIVKFGMPALNVMLDSRIAQIKKDLLEAENLRVEAQEMLAQYQRKHRDAVKEAETIIANAKENAEQYKKNVEEELNQVMKRREAQLEDRLLRMEQNAMNELQAYAADLAMNTAKEIIAEKLDKKVNSKLVDGSIEQLEANIH